jgi:hypothetical protein
VADNSTLDPGTGGDVIRDKDRAGIKTQIVGLDLGIGTGTESLMSGVMPVSDNSGSLTVDNAGTFAVQADTELTTADLDTGAGTDTRAVVGLALAASGGALLAGSANPVPISDNAGSITVDNGGTFAVQPAANSTVDVNRVAGTATSVNSGTKDAGTQRVILASDQTVVPVSDNSGSLTVDAPVGTPVFVTVTPSATGGWSKVKYAAQTTTVQTPKGTAGTFGGYYVYNPNGTVMYVQVFDAATATTITLGTTVPDMIFAIPAASAANLEISNGVNMANGIKLACTTTATGLTAPGTGLDMTVFYK